MKLKQSLGKGRRGDYDDVNSGSWNRICSFFFENVLKIDANEAI